MIDKRRPATTDSRWQSSEERVARELLNYFTGQHPTGVKYDNQPQEVRELWLGAARVAIKALQAVSREGGLSVSVPSQSQQRKARATLPKFEQKGFRGSGTKAMKRSFF